MPISKDEWDAGRTWETLEGRILTFLRNNRNQGFTFSEIMYGIGYRTKIRDFGSLIVGFSEVWLVQDTLKTLMKEGTVKAKTIKKDLGEETYYMAT